MLNYQKELVWIVILNIASFFLFAHFDFLEWLFELSRAYEQWQLDELIPLSMTLTVSFAVFSYRRWREVKGLYLEVEYLSQHDPLTGLLNRRGIEFEYKKYKENKEQLFAIYLSVQQFRKVNELLGYHVGDDVLKSIAKDLKQNIPKNAVLSRWGSVELLCLIPIESSLHGEKILEKFKVITKNNLPSMVSGLELNTVGVSVKTPWSLKQLMMYLDNALVAKQYDVIPSK